MFLSRIKRHGEMLLLTNHNNLSIRSLRHTASRWLRKKDFRLITIDMHNLSAFGRRRRRRCDARGFAPHGMEMDVHVDRIDTGSVSHLLDWTCNDQVSVFDWDVTIFVIRSWNNGARVSGGLCFSLTSCVWENENILTFPRGCSINICGNISEGISLCLARIVLNKTFTWFKFSLQ